MEGHRHQAAGVVIVKGPALSVVQKFHANGTHWMWKQNGEGSSGPVSLGGSGKSTRETLGESFAGETKSNFFDEKNTHLLKRV